MAGQGTIIVCTTFGILFLLGGIGLIAAGSVYLQDYWVHDYSSGSAWALLWCGIALELIGCSLLGVARRVRWHRYVERHHCHHHHPPRGTVVQYSTGNTYGGQAYNLQGYTGQPLGVPQAASFASPYGAQMPGPPSYEYAVPPPMSQAAPPGYEAPKATTNQAP